MNLKNKTGKCKKAEKWFRDCIAASDYDTRRLWVEMKKSKSRKGVVGYCQYPRGSGAYLIRAGVNFDYKYPFELILAIGSKPFAGEMAGKGFGFKWVEDKEEIRNVDDFMIWILGHELWHYLCHTKQAKGNYQTKANAYGFALLRAFKNGRKGVKSGR